MSSQGWNKVAKRPKCCCLVFPLGSIRVETLRRKRQRLDEAPLSHTANQLLEDIGTGCSNVNSAARLARQMGKDNLESPALAAIASLGSAGRCEQNIERDLHRWARGVHGVKLEPYKIVVPLEATR